jgi:anti-sigma factor RsiW
MDCDQYRARLHAYFHGSLVPADAGAVDGHAASCEPCGALMRVAREISCREFVAFLDAWFADELEPERRAIFERHLAICADCTAYLDSYRKTMELSVLALRGAPPVPARIPEALVRAILEARK